MQSSMEENREGAKGIKGRLGYFGLFSSHLFTSGTDIDFVAFMNERPKRYEEVMASNIN